MPDARVMLVEADASMQLWMLELFDELEINLDIVMHGAACVERVMEAPDAYDLIVMDINHSEEGEKTGSVDVRREVHLLSSQVPVLAVTDDCAWQDRRRAVAAGFCGVVVKPVDRDRLTKVITDLV
ncbi:MAG: response regulator [Marinovum sp.]|nr:response regulator [Marinovum sp.]